MKSKVSSTTNTTTRVSENMAAPVAIGTRGTVGSLIRREIEYFSRFETSFRKAAQAQGQQQMIVDMGTSSRSTCQSRHGFWFMIMSWKRKKRRGGSSSSSSSGFLPSICSASEVVVAEKDRLNGIPGFNYRILKS
ncbi:hypothetical protein Ddye_019636 [Dipteronia dyeriana]|uniref:Uncharacterized protein n=1 Tax=Dipteronia dyeriana TaxID=168575 RepID=A0AAD9TYD2_9ROSI|nr:hypothetical protein Ddye_019636 [Dipteronia dyeriana]